MKNRVLLIGGCLLSCVFAQAQDPIKGAPSTPPAAVGGLDAELAALAENPEAIAKGETAYRQMCFACHGAHLEGAAGPSLNDSDWLHGNRPSDILRVITKGVSEKGMMPYEAIYDEPTRKGLVAFILSQEVGFRDVAYEIYPPVADPADGLPSFGSGSPSNQAS